MKLELPLLPYLEIGERAPVAVTPIGVPDGPAGQDGLVCDYRSSNPAVVHVGPDGVLEGRAMGNATIAVEVRFGAGRAAATLDVRVIASEAPRIRLRPGHPRIRYTDEELRQRRAALSQGRLPGLGVDLHRQFRDLLARADAFAAEEAFAVTYQVSGETFAPAHPLPLRQPPPLPQPRGFTDYPFWTALARAIELRMKTLAMAYSFTGESHYALKAKEYLLAIADWRKWHEYDKATNNLSLPHLTIGAAVTYDEVWRLLTDDERAAARAGIVNLGLRPMSHMFHLRRDHNIPTLLNLGMVVGYLAIGDELPHLDKFFAIPFADLRWYLERREEGATTEGLLYTGYAMHNLLAVAAQIRRATDNDELFQYPFIYSTLPEQFLYFRGGQGGLANFSDAYHTDSSAPIMALLAEERAHPIAAWLIARFLHDEPSMLAYLTGDVAVASPAEQGLPQSKVFERMGWAALRSGWDNDDILLAFTASASAAGHNHFDQNHFILNVAGEWLLTDPGYQNYTPGVENFFTNATLGHNALLVNGEGQAVKGQARLVKSFLMPGFDYVAGDATGAYAGRLRRWVRAVIFVKPRYVLLVDDIAPSRPDDTLELLFHSSATMTRAGQRLARGDEFTERGDGVEIIGERAGVGLRVLHPAPLRCTYEQYPGAERFGPYLRVRPPAASMHRIVTLLQPWRDGDRTAPFAVQAQDVGGALQVAVEREDQRDVHHLDRAGAAGTADARAGEIACEGEYALVSRDRSTGAVTRVVLLEGTVVAARGQPLIRCDRPVRLAIAYDSEGATCAVSASAACRVAIHLPYAPRVLRDGAELSGAEVGYDASGQLVALALAPGTHELRLQRRGE